MSSCLIVVGEKSGEEHAMSFFPQLVKLCPGVQFYGVGGEELQKEGMDLLYHLKDFSSMGFSEVIRKIPFYFRALKTLEKEVIRRETKTAILVDFQDFNMRLAKKLKKQGVKVLYYVAPQAWAWKAGRAKPLSENTHTLFTILPFEKDWFSSRGVRQVKSIPHPLMLTYKNFLPNLPSKPFNSWEGNLKILLLPGSRRFEVYGLLPLFIQATEILKKSMPLEIHVVKVGHIDQKFYDLFKDNVDAWHDSADLPLAMQTCHFSLAASGTVTLSTALFELPTIVCYKASLLNEFIFHNFVKYSGPISLTNIIHQRRVFPEFIQSSVDPGYIAWTIKSWSSNEKLYNDMKSTLKQTKALLSGENLLVPEYLARVINE